jgi:hypothetical protein
MDDQTSEASMELRKKEGYFNKLSPQRPRRRGNAKESETR